MCKKWDSAENYSFGENLYTPKKLHFFEKKKKNFWKWFLILPIEVTEFAEIFLRVIVGTFKA